MPNDNKAQIKGVALNMNSIMSSGTGDSAMSDITGRTKEYKHLIDYVPTSHKGYYKNFN